jgi:hypothetical protein
VRGKRVMEAIAAVTDPRSSFYRLMRRENVPANELKNVAKVFDVAEIAGADPALTARRPVRSRPGPISLSRRHRARDPPDRVGEQANTTARK